MAEEGSCRLQERNHKICLLLYCLFRRSFLSVVTTLAYLQYTVYMECDKRFQYGGME